ncbi:MAG: aldehyde dehydrogenase, partial [Rhodospirillales bacterium]|nr:aldehyde dehydrogenase [Rhodospirillales bacterium]
MSLPNEGTLDRREVVATLLRDPGDLLVVSGLGAATYDVGATGDRPTNFYLWGAMGGAAMIGLGIALAQPRRRVLVITGDGEMLMGIGSIATLAAQAPANLAVAVLDNTRFGETGSQRSHTGLGTDLAAVAAACGWHQTATALDMAEVELLRDRLRRESLFAVIRISPEEKPRFL